MYRRMPRFILNSALLMNSRAIFDVGIRLLFLFSNKGNNLVYNLRVLKYINAICLNELVSRLSVTLVLGFQCFLIKVTIIVPM